MKISLNSIRRFNDEYKTADDIAAIGVESLVEKIGAQLGGVDEVIDIGKRYKGIVIVRVESCEQHPNADRLKVCLVDDGGVTPDVARNENGLVQVVCGAPNVQAGMLAAWLPPGAIVPETVGSEPFILESRDLRGSVSNGMLASPKELALGESHEGLLVLEGDYKPGSDFAEVFGLKDDVVIDIENKMFTHRPDCFGFMGVSRELAGIQGISFKSPDWYTPDPAGVETTIETLPVEVINEIPELVPRFAVMAMSDITVKASPAWLQVELSKVGLRPINNIVDLTNYYMILTGQPLHAYDYDKVKAISNGDKATLVVRNPRSGERITLLNGKEIDPRQEAIMIATDTKVIGLGGVMGGAETEVDNSTKNIIIEAATFDMYSIRRTSMAHGLFTDAVTRFNKGQSPLQNLAVLQRMASDVERFAQGKQASRLVDDNHLSDNALSRQSLHLPISLPVSFINERLGIELAAADVKQILENVEFTVEIEGETLIVQAPFWRTDIELREDIVEEVGRLYGYDRLPANLPRRDLTPAHKDSSFELKSKIRQSLMSAGANEVLTYSFVPESLLKKVGQDPSKAYQIGNALSPDLQYYRLNVLPSLLDKIHPNIKSGYAEFALFEMGKNHTTEQVDEFGLPVEDDVLALTYAANDKLRKPGAAYYEAKRILEYLLKEMGISVTIRKPLEADNIPMKQLFDAGRTAVIVAGEDESIIGVIGEFTPTVRQNLKLPKYSAGFEIRLDPLHSLSNQNLQYVPLPKFPQISQDITLKVPAGVSYGDLYKVVSEALKQTLPQNTLPTLSPLDIFQREEDTEHKQVTFRLTLASYDRTLTDAEVNNILETVAAKAGEALSAERL
jgi:phenylalanyl-tRNA synthetase beta chain